MNMTVGVRGRQTLLFADHRSGRERLEIHIQAKYAVNLT